jgi:inorganic pyrophosphatase
VDKIKAGKDAPGVVNVFIEIPSGSSVKYELDKESGVIFVDRFLYTEMEFPFNYGFVPGTLSGDGDPVDVLVLSSKPVVPGVVIHSKPIAMIEMEDESGIDNKVVAVPTEKINPPFGKWNDVSDIPGETKAQIKHFFENYKKAEPEKWVKVKEWKGKEAAIEEIRRGIQNYKP